MNAGEPQDAADSARRILSYGKLLLVTPLPDSPGGDLEQHDVQVAQGLSPALPDGSAVLPYRVSFVFTQASGLVSRITQAAQSYALTPFERLTLGGVEVAAED
jgi:hypothetical protein